MDSQFNTIIDSYLDSRVGIDKAFISKELSAGLKANILKLHARGLMKDAVTGNSAMRDPEHKTRTDQIYWLDKTHPNSFEQDFLDQAESFIEYLNRTCYTGIKSYEFHYAIYGKGSFYNRHIDQFKTDNKRKFSLVNYLNDDWLDTDGGELMVYPDDEDSRKISPCSQTAVFFKSDEMEHEVLMAGRMRMSVTGWLKTV